MFPDSDGTAKLSGRDHEFREPTLRQEQLVGSADLRGQLQGEHEGPQPTESKDDAEAQEDFWCIQGDIHLCSSQLTSRIRLEGHPHRYHEDHIAGKSLNSLSQSCLVHKFIPMPQTSNIPDAKAAVEKEWEKLEKIPAWHLTKVKNKSEVIDEARNKGRRVHFASLMDLCHLKNSEFGSTRQRSSRTPR